MIRRRFLQMMGLTTAGALVSQEAIAGTRSKTVIYEIKGFTCITCAVGLDTMLGKQEGVLSSHSTYPEGRATVSFDPDSVAEISIRAFIDDLGFTIVKVNGAKIQQ